MIEHPVPVYTLTCSLLAEPLSPVSPGPAANSSTVSPGWGSSLRIIHSLTGREFSHISSRWVYQPVAWAFQVALLR